MADLKHNPAFYVILILAIAVGATAVTVLAFPGISRDQVNNDPWNTPTPVLSATLQPQPTGAVLPTLTPIPGSLATLSPLFPVTPAVQTRSAATAIIPTGTPSRTPAPYRTRTPSRTPTQTRGSAPSTTPSMTATITVTRSLTPSLTPTPTRTPVITATITRGVLPTESDTLTPLPTNPATPTIVTPPTVTYTPQPTDTPQPTRTKKPPPVP